MSPSTYLNDPAAGYNSASKASKISWIKPRRAGSFTCCVQAHSPLMFLTSHMCSRCAPGWSNPSRALFILPKYRPAATNAAPVQGRETKGVPSTHESNRTARRVSGPSRTGRSW